ncbi:MAG: tetratricopeptide repeat protein [Acidobacteriia bacterium]|nr:tetratricopeptide repeat protein [Terriglobia bacterium]
MRSSTRHQLKEDQFRTTAKETYSWAVEHRGKLVYGVVAGAAVLAIMASGWFYLQQQDEAAGVALGHALQVYQAPLISAGQPSAPETTSFATTADRGKAARAEFAKVTEKYAHTNSAEIARYFMGLTDQDAGNTAAAEKELKEVAESGRSDLAALAKFALAALYRTQGKDAQAVPIYKDLIEHPTDTISKAQTQLALASVYESKQPQDARTLYQQVQKENPDSPAAQIASARLADLK